MWVVIYMAHNKKVADTIADILNRESILFKMKSVYKNVTFDRNCYEVLVPQSEAIVAQAVLMENGY